MVANNTMFEVHMYIRTSVVVLTCMHVLVHMVHNVCACMYVIVCMQFTNLTPIKMKLH